MLKIYITRDKNHMSQVAAEIAEVRIKTCQASKRECVLGLATGSSPTSLYKLLADAFNTGRIDAQRMRSFNLDEYVGLPGENAQQRALNCKSYGYFMIWKFFSLLQKKFIETSVPYGAMVEQDKLTSIKVLHPGNYQVRGTSGGKAVTFNALSAKYLRKIRKNILDAYQLKIAAAGGIDLQIIGVGGHGHVAFHESGIPFADSAMLLVELDEHTRQKAVNDGNFASLEECPKYAISMGAELVYQAKTVLLLASDEGNPVPVKAGPVAKSLLLDETCDVPISYGQTYIKNGGELIYVLDKAAAKDLLGKKNELMNKYKDKLEWNDLT